MLSVCVAEMGDKTQLFVIGLSTKRRVRDVLFGVGIATVLLNIMGVFMGNIISKIFPIEYVRIAAGFFFLIFALLTIGKNEDNKSTDKNSIIGIATAFFIAELGDKTQLSSIAFAANDPQNAMAVFMGATCGMLIADGVGILIAKIIGKQMPEKMMKLLAYTIFTAFGFKTLYENFYLFLPNNGVSLTFTIAALYIFFSIMLFKSKKVEC